MAVTPRQAEPRLVILHALRATYGQAPRLLAAAARFQGYLRKTDNIVHHTG